MSAMVPTIRVRGSGRWKPHRVVERVRTRAGERERRGGDDEGEVELISAFAVPEAVGQVDGGDCDEHRADDREAAERRQETERQQETAAELGQGRNPRPRLSGSDAELLNGQGPVRHARAAPPAEELLGAMGCEDQADSESKNQKSKRGHRF
jgi:hypothetical protein